ncbi:MAG: 50S ribosomal protein L1 [Phycisphaerae bacterium]|nr:50S ribosomal protein L1 [Phycisphaerae bacterium]
MSKKIRGKNYKKWAEKVPADKVSLAEGVGIVKTFRTEKWDPSVNLTMWLGIDPKQADQALRGAVSLPHGIGATKKVIAFCDGDDIARAKAAGAIEAGSDELIKKVADGWLDFDVAVATPALMKNVSRLGRVLGPQGKMPSPKAGTVVTDISTAVKEYAAGKVEYRNDDGGNLHVVIGKASFEANLLVENAEAMIQHIRRAKPATAKGQYFKGVCLSTTMSPAVKVDVQ